MSDDGYGNEGLITLSWGGAIRFEAYTDAVLPSYVRIVDQSGAEIAYWNVDEFTEDAPLVLGAFLGLAQNGPTTIAVRVRWDASAEPQPPSLVRVPIDIYNAGYTQWDDPVATYLSDRYGFLVTDWQPSA
jgi:hypothetical protein